MLTEKKARIHTLDEIRGFAILCMIFHHTFLDVGDVLGYEWGYDAFDFLCNFQPIFWAAFIVISGICTRLSRNCIKRGFIVETGALVISLITAVIMPLMNFTGAEIYFGILHCLGICMILTGLLMPVIKKIDYRIGAAVSIALFFFFYGIDTGYLAMGLIKLPSTLYQFDFLAPLGLHSPEFYSADYFPLVPWIFMFFFGAFVGKFAQDGAFPAFMYRKRSKFLSFVGRNSLWIYLAHQPVIYGIMMIIVIMTALAG